MEIKRDYYLRLADEKKLKELVKTDPNLVFSGQSPQFIPEHLAIIGIDYHPDVMSSGYIKNKWADFIVEEISNDFEIISVEDVPENHPNRQNLQSPKSEADLVKQGMPTIEAVERLAESLKINELQISYAGMKDSEAITAQKITIDGLTPEKLQNITVPNLFLKNIHERRGIEKVGNLYGNRFTILVRTQPQDLAKLKQKVDALNRDGFYNFYSLQRFGGARLNSHKTGGRILRGEYEDAVKMLLVGTSVHEMPILQNLRNEAATHWGDWAKMYEIFSQFPYFLYYELLFLDSLKANSDFSAALKAVPYETKMCVYGYFSYWFNKLLSKKIVDGNVPQDLPLLRNFPESIDPYRGLIPEDQLNKIKFNQPGFEFLKLNKPLSVPAKIVPKIWHVYETSVGCVFHFDLKKGAYATTMLAEFFHLYQGKPVPEWVNQSEFDTRELIGYRPSAETIAKFPKVGNEEDLIAFVE